MNDCCQNATSTLGHETSVTSNTNPYVGCGRTLCEEKVWASLEFPANLCCTFHNVRLSITGIGVSEFTKFQLDNDQASKPSMEEEQIDPIPLCAHSQSLLTRQ